MKNNDDLYGQLFNGISEDKLQEMMDDKVSTEKSLQDYLSLISSANLTESVMDKTFILRLVCGIAVRLSLIASVWLFIFNPNLWYGILIFAVLSLIFGGVRERHFNTRG